MKLQSKIRYPALVLLLSAAVVGMFFMMYPFHRIAPSPLLLRIGAIIGVVTAAVMTYVWFTYGLLTLSRVLFLLGNIAICAAAFRLETPGVEIFIYGAVACFVGAFGVRRLWERK